MCLLARRDVGAMTRYSLGDDWEKIRAAYTLAGGELEDIARATLSEFLLHYQSRMTLLKNPRIPN
ncbi:DUF1804 family protein, partial [Kingella kingae]|uniref:DUF1804 family protein n=1 Tax=Kingella kingae TaxID=504 RepID=UPI001E305DBC